MIFIQKECDAVFRKWSRTGIAGVDQNWTSLYVQDTKVINILEGIDWGGETLDIGICEHCGGNDGPDIYVDISQSSGNIWLTPHAVYGYVGDVGQEKEWVSGDDIVKTVVVSEEVWNEWNTQGIVDKPVKTIVPTTYSHLKAAWLAEGNRVGWLISDDRVFDDIQPTGFVSDRLSQEEFIRFVRLMLDALNRLRNDPLAGNVEIVRKRLIPGESAWFLEDGKTDWHAFARAGEKLVPSFGNGLFYLNDPAISLE